MNKFYSNLNAKAPKADYTSNMTVSGGVGGAKNIIKMDVKITGIDVSNLVNKVLMIVTGSSSTPFSALTFGIFAYVYGASVDIGHFTTLCADYTCGSSNTPSISNSFLLNFDFNTDITGRGADYYTLKKFLVL